MAMGCCDGGTRVDEGRGHASMHTKFRPSVPTPRPPHSPTRRRSHHAQIAAALYKVQVAELLVAQQAIPSAASATTAALGRRAAAEEEGLVIPAAAPTAFVPRLPDTVKMSPK